MAIGDPRFEAAIVVRLAEPSRMGELKPDEETGIAAGRLAMRVDECLAQLRNSRFACRRHAQLVGVGPTVRPHRDGLAAPDELGAAQTETAPAARGVQAR